MFRRSGSVACYFHDGSGPEPLSEEFGIGRAQTSLIPVALIRWRWRKLIPEA